MFKMDGPRRYPLASMVKNVDHRCNSRRAIDYLGWWRQQTGRQYPITCCVKTCTKKGVVGARVAIKEPVENIESFHVILLCRNHARVGSFQEVVDAEPVLCPCSDPKFSTTLEPEEKCCIIA